MLVTIVKNAIKNNRLAHSYLIIGEMSESVKNVLFEVVKILNCESMKQKPCNNCPRCKSVEGKSFHEMVYVDEHDEAVGIEVIRELQKFTAFSPLESFYKVIIIPFAERMTKEAANSFLKTLEEPLDNILFLLHTEDEKRVPSTIISRCQRIFLRPEIKDTKKNTTTDVGDFLNHIDDMTVIERMSLVKKGLKIDAKEMISILFDKLCNKINNLKSLNDVPDLISKSRMLFDMKKYLTYKVNQQLWLENFLISWGTENE